jgi:hypothetical protein
MSEAVTVTDLATPKLQRIIRHVQRPRVLMQAVGRRVEGGLHGYFLERNQQPNKQGWWKSNWWNREVKRNTAYQGASDTEATVSIASRQFLQRLRGGRITGNPFLALPLTEQAKRKGSPGEWTSKGDGQLTFIRSKTGVAYLFPGDGKGHGASYLLVRSVNQKPDPHALPPQSDIEDWVEDEAVKFAGRVQAL